eukprot:2022973-Rhodomonas_salina.1
MFTKATSDNILSYALLKLQGYHITLAEGLDDDPTFCWTITTPDGESTITLVFDGNMYRLPLPEDRRTKRAKTKPPGVEHPIFLRPMILPSLFSDTQLMQFHHDSWGHPSDSMDLKNFKHWQGK